MIQEFIAPGHFYSVIPNITSNYTKRELTFLDLDFNDESHMKILNELPWILRRFDLDFGFANFVERQSELKFSILNNMFGWMDARLLYYFLQQKPKKIIEIGSGNSTLLTYNTKKYFNLELDIICIEPFPSEYLKKLHEMGEIVLFEKKVQDIDICLFKTLSENDILFIDSSHVLKLESDVMFYFTKIFPILQKNVMIHIHDVFFPYDYPLAWTKGGVFWNEQYALYLFLQHNAKFKIQFCNAYSEYKFPEKLKMIQKETYEIKNKIAEIYSGGSIWIKVN